MAQQVDFDIVVIGGGIIGLATAYKIGQSHPGIKIGVMEKEKQLAAHQTGRNSGVIHSGLYYKPGSAKAKTCAEGRKQLIAFAKKHKIKFKITGKVIVAAGYKELVDLEEIYENGVANEIKGIEKIDPEEIEKVEPFCKGVAGIRVPTTGIIDFTKVAEKLGELIELTDNKILTSHKVIGFDRHDFYTKVRTNRGAFRAGNIINCAGLQCDRIAQMDGVDAKMRIVPFRGDYYELTEDAAEKVKALIYPVPNPAFPFLGVHFTRTMDGQVECGPNAVFSFKREGYGKVNFSLKDSWQSLSYKGTWKMFLKHWLYGLDEYTRAFSKKLFVKRLQRLIPSLQAGDIRPGKSGVRAQAVGLNGGLIDDFRIERKGNAIHVLNAPSPAATAALAIGDYINYIATDHFKLEEQ
ncbi:MAG: L-2-hydroxyglutarate oxidase [Planctomycetota bacterium]|jgi:L-2-hydroxyglutarate oxidase LhgO